MYTVFDFVLLFFLAKKKNKKGKTLTLTDFLAEDSGGSGPVPSYPTKTTSWADETDDLDGDGQLSSVLCLTIWHNLNMLSFGFMQIHHESD